MTRILDTAEQIVNRINWALREMDARYWESANERKLVLTENQYDEVKELLKASALRLQVQDGQLSRVRNVIEAGGSMGLTPAQRRILLEAFEK